LNFEHLTITKISTYGFLLKKAICFVGFGPKGMMTKAVCEEVSEGPYLKAKPSTPVGIVRPLFYWSIVYNFYKV